MKRLTVRKFCNSLFIADEGGSFEIIDSDEIRFTHGMIISISAVMKHK